MGREGREDRPEVAREGSTRAGTRRYRRAPAERQRMSAGMPREGSTQHRDRGVTQIGEP